MTPEQEQDLDHALLAYWNGRDEARIAQENRGRADTGERAGVTAGTHLDRIAQLLARVCITAGAPWDQVYYKAPKGDPNRRKNLGKGFTLPGYYRPTKEWDLVVHHQGKPVVAVELKSQSGPSYSNNANNRAEEAIGNAVDLARATKSGLIPARPWMGYVYVIEDDVLSRQDGRGKDDASFLDQDPIFAAWSYISRVDLLCQRLVADGYYDSSWAIATSRPCCPAGPRANLAEKREKCPQFKINKKVIPDDHEHRFTWSEPNPQLNGYVQFITALTAQVGEHYPDAPASGVPDITVQEELDLGLR